VLGVDAFSDCLVLGGMLLRILKHLLDLVRRQSAFNIRY